MSSGRPPAIGWEGSPAAPVCVIGECPGTEEEAQGRPFVGPSGRMLRSALRSAGLDPEKDVRYGNVYPRNVNPFPKGEKRDELLLSAAPWVRENLAGSSHKLIVCVGGTSLHALTGRDRVLDSAGGEGSAGALLTRHRAPLYPLPELPGTAWGCVLHPSSVLRSKGREGLGTILMHLRNYVAGIVHGQAELFGLRIEDLDIRLNDVSAVQALRGRDVAFDTEYDPDTYKAHLIGFADVQEPRVVWAFTGTDYTLTILDILGNARTLIAHNIEADLRAAETTYRGFRRPTGGTCDTMITAKLLQPDQPVSLGSVARFYLLVEPWKYMRGEAMQELTYNALDVAHTAEIWRAMMQHIRRDPQLISLHRHQQENLLRVLDMAREGMRVDLELLDRWRRQHQRNMDRYRRYVLAAIRGDLAEQQQSLSDGQASLEQSYHERLDTERRRIQATLTCSHGLSLKVRPRNNCDECMRGYNEYRAVVERLKPVKKQIEALKRLNAVLSDFNPLSDDRLRWLVFDVWQIKTKGRFRRTPKGKVSLDEQAIERLSDFCTPRQQRVLRAVVRIRQLRKALSTFLGWDVKNQQQSPGFPLVGDHLHPDIKIHGTKTGRPSSGSERVADLDLDDVSLSRFNAFNIPKRYRRLFIPREGYTFVGGDFSDLEGRMVCLDSGDKQLAAWYSQGLRVHTERGLLAFPDCPREEARTRVAIQRGQYAYTVDFLGKKLGHGSHYGMGVRKIADELRLPVKVAQEIWQKIFWHHPEILSWQQRTIEQVWGVYDAQRRRWVRPRTRKLRTAFGRIRYFFGAEQAQKNEALAYRPQSHGADVWFRVLNRITQKGSSKLREPWDGRVVTGTYDSFLCEIRVDQAEDFAVWLKQQAEREIRELRVLPGAQLMRPSFPFKLARGNTYYHAS